jgi:hypothetical protein
LKDVLRGEKILVKTPIVSKGKDGFVHLGFEGNFNIYIPMNRCQAGQAKAFVILPLGQFGMFGGVDCPLKEFDLAFSTDGTPATGRIDMDPRLHGSLEEVLLLIDPYLSFAGVESDFMLRHEKLNKLIITFCNTILKAGGGAFVAPPPVPFELK